MTKSYGAMRHIMSFLKLFEQTMLQILNKWFYNVAVGRVQTKIELFGETGRYVFHFSSGYYLDRSYREQLRMEPKYPVGRHV